MWENSSAYSRVRFEDIAPITSFKILQQQRQQHQEKRRSTNLNKHRNPNLSQHQLRQNANYANYNNIERLILCLMETLQ